MHPSGKKAHPFPEQTAPIGEACRFLFVESLMQIERFFDG
jgi:hypothetical protein